QRLDQAPPARQQQLEPKVEPRVVDWKPDGKVVRALLRGMLRFGDLTDVGMFKLDHPNSFADEFKLQNFVVRSHLPSSTKVSEEQLLKTAAEISERAQRAIEDKQDNMKYADVEIKPSQVIERLYDNLKLRVAVQRALRDAKYAKRDDKGAYVLVAKQSDLPVLGISRDFPPWSWAEKEHDWNSRKDTALLLGIYVHGFGAWEDILNDDLLHFHQQRALKGERMKKRAENLLKRLPPPDESGDPKIVHNASVLVAGSQNSGPSLGAQFSAIINSNNPNKGRLERAAQRFAARQSSGASSIPESRVVAEDSIRRSHTQANSSSSVSSSSNAPDRQRKTSIPSSSPRNDEPEDGEVGGSSSAAASSTAAGRSSTSSKSSSSSKRAASIETEQIGGGSPRKKSKHHSSERSRKHRDRDASSTPSKTKKARILTEEQCVEKWKPSKKLKDIRQVLKKMKIMADWSKNQTDEVVVEKVCKYVITIGEAIDD
uniref:ATP-dependent helicase CHD1-2/hrp3 HTH domain-containing protein n=1 Tax=Globisporangium ultimum (strain ATCC 200006 / CBS 805.95 / DAOM BR144) TaxID=431595 RepID=K3W757_GLOUD